MTNVPNNFREAIAEAYKLFDVSFLMKGTDEDWIQYWDKANKLIQKYGDGIPMMQLVEAYAGIIATEVKRREKEANIRFWGKDEDYPYPKGGSEI